MKRALVALLMVMGMVWPVGAEQRFQGGSGSAANLAADGEEDEDKATNAADRRLDLQALGLRLVDGNWQGDERTYAHICSAKTFAALDDLREWTDIWVDPATGSDTDPGTEGEPFETAARVNTYVAANGCGTRINVVGGSTFAGTDLTGGFNLTGSCDGPAVWIRSDDPENPFHLDGTGVTMTNAFYNSTSGSADGTVAIAFVENARVENLSTGDVISSHRDEAIVALRVYGEASGASNNILTSHTTSQTWGIQTSGSVAVSGASATIAVAPIANSRMGVLCPGEYRTTMTSASTSSRAAMVSDDAEMVTIGASYVLNTGAFNAQAVEVNPSASGHHPKLRMARAVVVTENDTSASNAIRVIVNGSGELATAELYQTTVRAATGHGIATGTTPGSGASWTIRGRGLLLTDVASYLLSFSGGDFAAGTLDLRNTVYDDEVITNSFRLPGDGDSGTQNITTAALAQDEADAEGDGTWVIMDASSLRGGSTQDGGGDQSDGAPPAHPNICAPGKACQGLLREEYVVDFGVLEDGTTPFCLPASILPVPVCSMRLGGLTADAGYSVANRETPLGLLVASVPPEELTEQCVLPGEIPCSFYE